MGLATLLAQITPLIIGLWPGKGREAASKIGKDLGKLGPSLANLHLLIILLRFIFLASILIYAHYELNNECVIQHDKVLDQSDCRVEGINRLVEEATNLVKDA